VDNAIALVESKLPPATDADMERWLVAGLAACANAGLVAVHDMGMSVASARILAKLDAEKKLPLRVFVYLDGSADESYAYLGTTKPSPMLEVMGVKLYADGAMGSRGAALLADYADDPGNKGLLVMEPADLAARVKRVHAKGFAAAVHAIGDRGNRVVLDALDASPAPNGMRDRIEHAQLVAPEDFARFAKRGVVASMQPTHATSDMRWAEARVGKERVKGAYAWQTMLANGVMLAFGSDAPVESEKPAWGIYAAITRQDHAGAPKEGFLPEQRMTQHQALVGFATGAAYAVSHERELGALTPGMFFDVTLFEKDVAAPKDWINAKPVGTIVAGTLRTTEKVK
jgi:predicted amidohydrolase YtcJ